ncbi:MAG: PAS domain-containing protein [Campylobacterota bacterium]|nr:PAS domain-containing protein [Campylobacterota bacterium]
MSLNRETVLLEDAFLVTETDAKGKIIFANDEFCKIAEYEKDEIMNKNHNIVRDKDMPKAAFKDLWDTVKKGEVWSGFVKNTTKSGGYYWVFATVYPFLNEDNEQCYLSCRRKPSKEDILKYDALYKTMR